jgi:glutamate/tyrosine decarboxylase-like PLP-dependent enzyme
MGALAEFLAATMNTNSGGLAYHSANYVENQVINWMKEIMGFPETASGLLTSGCSAANLIGLTVARNTKAEIDIRKSGLHSTPKQMVLYASEEIHSSVQKAVEILGLGSLALRYIAAKDDFRINLKELKTRIFEDRQAGYSPFCIVGAAGTTNTGAVDDLNALADICQEEDLWLHVDGAFGAWAVLSSSAKELVSGMERADSLAFDLHKWMYMPYEIGCVLVRQGQYQRESFSIHADYLVYGETNRGLVGDDLPWLSDYGFQLSRAFNSLKAWMSFKEHGIEKYGRLIQQNIEQARYLARLIKNSPKLELAAPVSLNAVVFRYVHPELEKDELDRINKEIISELQEQGIAVVSGTIIHGRWVLHVVNTNHRSVREDFDVLIRETLRLGDELSQI